MSDVSSVLSLADDEDLLEDSVLSSVSSSKASQQGELCSKCFRVSFIRFRTVVLKRLLPVYADINDSARNDVEDDVEDNEDLFELASEKNEEVNSSKEEDEEAEGVEELLEGQSDADDPDSEQLSQQRAIIMDIRFTHLWSFNGFDYFGYEKVMIRFPCKH